MHWDTNLVTSFLIPGHSKFSDKRAMILGLEEDRPRRELTIRGHPLESRQCSAFHVEGSNGTVGDGGKDMDGEAEAERAGETRNSSFTAKKYSTEMLATQFWLCLSPLSNTPPDLAHQADHTFRPRPVASTDPPQPAHSSTSDTVTLHALDQQPGSPPSFRMRTGSFHQQAHHPSPDRPTTIPTPLPSPTPHPMTTRARNGIYKPNSKYFSNFHAMTTTTISPLPKDLASAIRDPNWKNAMLDEFNALVANKTWELVPRPPDVNVIRSMWIFCHKRKSDGSFQRHKAHLVGDEKTQQSGVDCDEIFSPVVKPATIRTVLSIAISKSWHIHQLDVKNAFLHGYLNETVYMHQPMGFCDKGCPDHVYLLNKSLYGLKLAPRACFFLGIAMSRDANGMFLSQKQYTTKIIERAGMANCSSCPTPIDTKPKLSASKDSPYEDPTKYRSLAGALQYLTYTRPNISYVVQQICLHMHDPKNEHMSALKRILLYLQGTLSYGLHLYKSSFNKLISYTDTDWGGCPDTRRSTSDYCVFLGNPVQHQRTKHIEMDIHFVREKVAKGDIRVLHVPSHYQITDIFTKGLPRILFEYFRASLSVREPPISTVGLCGVRSDVANAAKVLFWKARKGLSFVLTFESERDRNSAIMVARKYALDCNVVLAGPDDLV
ncbi:Retrovirus-related Pol polyprotein from transposon RE2 [Glycine soja]|uniref:Retrovirus-related Pol polyprotein from transposon RE2 n=1 Tax=Glycine soja TaxID=3848 RepID=A0A445LAM7_GLYSO|nr:Retrovirus-related Pol polyprotein from transposon RE2 [Glycine soja]